MNQNSFPWQRRTCSPISPTMSLNEPSGVYNLVFADAAGVDAADADADPAAAVASDADAC